MTKKLPHSEDAEKGVLSSVLIDPKCMSEVAEKVTAEYFYLPTNKTVFTHLLEYWENGKTIDLITFSQYLSDKGVLPNIGGPGYITTLFTFVPTSDNVSYYLDILKDKFILRSIINTAQESIARAYQEQANVEAILTESQVEFQAIKGFPVKEKTVSDLLQEKLERMQSGEPDADVIKTFLKDLDLNSPLHRGDMPLITAERKGGKSTTAMSIFTNICLGLKTPGIWFSLEDPARKVIDRMSAGVSRIPMNSHHVTKLTQEEITKFQQAVDKINSVPISIYSDAFDLPVIISRMRKMKERYPDLGVAVVDYAQLVRVPFKKGQNREAEVATVSRAMRLLAIELDVPILLLSQLNEDGKSRESRALENDATANWNIENLGENGKRLLNIKWQRDGESDIDFPVTFLGSICRVENFRRPEENIA